ncbi:hypothetical protein HN51_061221 [Arachis hypogaea]|nr:uncharacterized protein LOC112719884 isoform X1 [Arachis hypogaea]XP_025626397.1 uncharacterized protein LOC112719884 isoform X1 [Arachis hypogaea]XP_025626398.1 uncharacterized protein LOC112719884 isoform X1 [Arachis hypogaea]QHO18411.1 Single myb histone [Arachis hypogaea]
MDPDIARWVAEFHLRSSAPDSLVSKILRVLNLSGADPKLKKTLLLRTLRSQLCNASITETALEILEQIEAIDRNDAVPIIDSMRRAYCAVAVECTVKFLAASYDGTTSGEYLSAVTRIWRGRVEELEQRQSELFFDEIARWRDDIEAALFDTRVSDRLKELNTRNDAFTEVRFYLQEVWETMGPSFLESVAEMTKNKGKTKGKGKELPNVILNPVPETRVAGCTTGVCRNASGAEHARDHGVDDNGDDDNDGSRCMDGVEVKRAEGSVDGTQEPAKEKKARGNPQLQRKLPAFRRCSRGVKMSSAEELGTERSWRKNDTVLSGEVKTARESLKSSFSELRALVNDPLPEALDISDAVRSKLARKGTNHEQPMENHSRDVDVPNSNTCRAIIPYQPKDAEHKKSPSVRHSRVNAERPNSTEPNNTAHKRPSLMEPNGTSQTYEWNDSIENMPNGMQLRRKKRKWSSLEEETLRTGVQMFGAGNWKTIQSFYSDVFEHRLAVDLKDKWRNMMRY